MNTIPRRHNNWLIIGRDNNGKRHKERFLFYSRRDAIRLFREKHNCVGKHGAIETVIPQFGWY
ncbi:hypothetical protein HT667_04470 [Ursidibacter maritimus]|uniref:hypothetical protein n=1 Tax=Ursidibacter maritimus TaxID=1331689 RepID=UPI001C464933|nr:hypothetical protein [Ursidibacter maritimus]MBV6540723.1 hypothetical protein [Ursidibacter maritimus]